MTVSTRLELGISVVPIDASVDSKKTMMYSASVKTYTLCRRQQHYDEGKVDSSSVHIDEPPQKHCEFCDGQRVG